MQYGFQEGTTWAVGFGIPFDNVNFVFTYQFIKISVLLGGGNEFCHSQIFMGETSHFLRTIVPDPNVESNEPKQLQRRFEDKAIKWVFGHIIRFILGIE